MWKTKRAFHKIRCTLWGAPEVGAAALWGLYWDPPFRETMFTVGFSRGKIL